MSDPSDIRKSTVSSNHHKKTVSFTLSSLVIIKTLVIVLALVLVFWLGLYIGHHHNDSNTTDSNTAGIGGVNRHGDFGIVKSVSSSSISVESYRTGSTKTYSITSSTKITNDGSTTSTSSISDNDSVIVIASSSNSNDASEIIVNPSFGGLNPGGPNIPASGTSNPATQ